MRKLKKLPPKEPRRTRDAVISEDLERLACTKFSTASKAVLRKLPPRDLLVLKSAFEDARDAGYQAGLDNAPPCPRCAGDYD